MGAALSFKQMLVGTAAGRAALSLRDSVRLVRAPRLEVGTLVNDHLAGRLAVALCPPQGTFVDIGAHIGSIISDVYFRHPLARVFAFEAIPEKAAALRRKFPAATVHELALWDSEGEASFFVDREHSSCSSLHRIIGAREISVRTRRLDAVLPGLAIDVIKIDVEGAELGVLRGATGLFDIARPVIMFESGPEVRFGFTKTALFAFFAEHDYGIFAPDRIAHTGDAMAVDTFLDSHEYPRRTTNYLALPAERMAAIRAQARAIKA